MSLVQIILVVIVAFIIGCSSVNDQIETYQPVVACSLIGLVTGHLELGVMLGGSLQLITMGWANVGAAMAPDASLAAVASTIILILGGQGTKGIGPAIALAVPLAVAGLALTMVVRTATVFIAHIMDSRAEAADIAGVERWHFIGMALQGLRVAIPALLLLLIPAHLVQSGLEAMPEWLKSGMTIGGGMVVAVGYAMVINMMSSREVWPFFFLGFALAALKELTLISLGIIGLCLAVMYLALEASGSNGSSNDGGSGDPLGEILEDFELGGKKMADSKIKLTKADRFKAFLRSYFLLASFNYERMQNGGVAYTLIPAIKKLYQTKEDRAAALKRHLEFFNTQPFMANPIFGVTLALEEERANGAEIDDAAISGVKVGMMGPLAGASDPLFWFTLRPIFLSLGAGLAVSGNVLGPIVFFVLWNVMVAAVKWYTQEFGYRAGTAITDDLSGNLLQQVTRGASMMGMFVIGSLIQRWVSITFTPVVSVVKQQEGAYIDWDKLPKGIAGVKAAFLEQAAGKSLEANKVTTLQDNLNQLIPGLAALGLTFLCMYLLKRKVSPIVIILGIFVLAIVLHIIGVL